MNLGENIYQFRTQKNLSQGDLADALEVSRQSVSKWENNSAVPELEKLMKMAQIFGISLDELVTGEEKLSPAPAPVQEIPKRISTQQVVGILLLTLGILLSLVCLILSIVMNNRYEHDLLMTIPIIGIPLMVIGLCCLLAKKHPVLVFAWVMYTPVFLYTQANMYAPCENIFIPMNSGGLNTLAISILATAIFGAGLYAITIAQMYKGKLQVSPFMRKLVTALMILSLVPTLVMFLIAQFTA